jgi:elongation factor P
MIVTPNDFQTGELIELDGEIYTVVEFQHIKIAQRRAFMRTKLKNLKTGSVQERNFDSQEKLKAVDLERKKATFQYKSGSDYIFMDLETYDQAPLPQEVLGESVWFLTENCAVTVFYYDGRPLSIEVPTFVELKIVETEPNFRGDTASGSSKPAKLETGLTVSVPFFVNAGDVVRIDTRNKTYLERVLK